MATAKVHTVTVHRKGKEYTHSGTLEELTECFKYTLECGQSYEREKGNAKINCHPKTLKSLVSNLNKAKTNSAANGCPDTYYLIAE